MSAQQHQSDPAILERRTLEKDHRTLAELLTPGLSVLDVGCGSGAITKGIAEAVGPAGRVVGIDRDHGLIERARSRYPSLPQLSFVTGDAASLDLEPRFDIVTSARMLQWIANPAEAIAGMIRAARPGGWMVVLDYNHSLNTWTPDPPPPAFVAFYSAFLQWRSAHGWDNEMGNRLPELFRAAGLIDIQTRVQNETAEYGQPDFLETTAIWSGVIGNVAANLCDGGYSTGDLLEQARSSYEAWRRQSLRTQTLSLTAVTARVPFGR